MELLLLRYVPGKKPSVATVLRRAEDPEEATSLNQRTLLVCSVLSIA